MDDGWEQELAVRCRNGDSSAYAGLVRAYSGRVFAICLAMLGDRHDAEDIAQQTLLNGLRGIGVVTSNLARGSAGSPGTCALTLYENASTSQA